MSEHDLIVIGLGVGGEEVAGRAADGGMDVLGIEARLVGGECPYWACIPTKIMVRAADALAESRRAGEIAGETSDAPDWAPVVERVTEATADWNDQAAVERLEDKGGTFARGRARITGPKDVEVDGERFAARRGIVIAAGSRPAVPPVDGLDKIEFWTNREAVESKEVPQSLVVMGAGPIGLEFAQVYRRFGADVTIVETADHVLPAEEPENAHALQEVLRGEGISLHMGIAIESVGGSSDGIVANLKGGVTLEAERLLVATGRSANLDRLGGPEVGLDSEARVVPTDGHLRAGDGLWAVGDVTGKGQFTHVAVYQGRVAAADILGRDHAPADYSAVPRVTFTDPEVASVGISERTARANGVAVVTGVSETASSARGWIHGPGAEHGVCKLVADEARNVLIGASVMGPGAGEVIGLLTLAVRRQIPVPELRDLIYPYPTFVRGIEDALTELG